MTPLPLQGQCNRHPLQANDGRRSLTQSNFAFICAPSTCRTSAVSCSSSHLLPKHFPRLLSNSPPRCICIVARSDARFHPSRQHSAAHPCEHSVVPHRSFLLSLRDHIQVQPISTSRFASPFPISLPPPSSPHPSSLAHHSPDLSSAVCTPQNKTKMAIRFARTNPFSVCT